MEYFKTVKDYIPIISDIGNIKHIDMDNNYMYDKKHIGVQLTEDVFNNNSSIIV